MWLNRSVEVINAMFQILDIYKYRLVYIFADNEHFSILRSFKK